MPYPVALKEIQQAFEDGKIARLLATALDPGEAEAIALALEPSADLTPLDCGSRASWARLQEEVLGISGE